jgi:hypothetical protein
VLQQVVNTGGAIMLLVKYSFSYYTMPQDDPQSHDCALGRALQFVTYIL